VRPGAPSGIGTVIMLKSLLSATVLAALLGSGAHAQGVSERQVIDQLRDQGFSEFRVSRTLLGRTMIVATNREYRREIVINPATGVILRDYWRALGPEDADDDDTRLISPRSGNSGSGSSGGSGRDDDDDDGSSSSSSSGGSSGGGSRDDDDDDGGSSGGSRSSGSSGSGSGGSSGGGDDNDDDNDDG
jgi:uncharacterized membrane protein YgcG